MRIQTRLVAYPSSVEDFIRRLLEVRPEIRLSAQGCLEHPWLLGAGDDLAAVREGRVPYPEPLPLVPDGATSQGSVDVSMSMSIIQEHGGNGVVADMRLDDRRGAVGSVQQQKVPFPRSRIHRRIQRTVCQVLSTTTAQEMVSNVEAR